VYLLSLEVETERRESIVLVHIYLLSFLSPINGEKKVNICEPIGARALIDFYSYKNLGKKNTVIKTVHKNLNLTFLIYHRFLIWQ